MLILIISNNFFIIFVIVLSHYKKNRLILNIWNNNKTVFNLLSVYENLKSKIKFKTITLL